MSVGANIRKRRYELKMTQAELAAKLKTSKQAIGKYEKGIVTNIPLNRIEELAEALNTTPAYLCEWPDPAEDIKKKFNLQFFAEPLTPVQQKAIEMIRAMSDDDLRKFIAMGKIMLGEK